jgi:hypothetical protein
MGRIGAGARPGRRSAPHPAALALALLLAAGPAGAQPAPPSPTDLLAQVKAATGGQRWDAVRGLTAVGVKTSFGLSGPYRAAEDLVTGRFARGADYGLFANAEGLDEGGRWRMDNSGAVHPLDSDEARAVAATEAYLASRGYLFPDRAGARLVRLPPATEDGRTFERIEATPQGGGAVALWIARDDRRLRRAVFEVDGRTETIRYGDYRPVGGLWLPFDIVTGNGDQPDVGEARIARYDLNAMAADPRRPARDPADSRIAGGAPVAYAPFRRDSMTGFAIVEASIDGHGPLPFILDTGGHDILTPAAARSLGLPLKGSGFSLGAGEGSSPTQFTKVGRVALGEAEMRDQPFVVLGLDLGQAMNADGRPVPIAGILGLELFERFTVTLDPAAGRIALRLPAADAPAGGAPIRFTSDMPLARAAVDGREGWFALDTGNNAQVILFKAWVDAQDHPGWFDVTLDVTGSGVGGAVVFRQGRAGEIALAGRTLQGLPVLLAPERAGSLSSKAAAGNIGESVLSRYAVTFDYAHETVRLDPPSYQVSPAVP